jgi:hypothetical protein
MTLTVVLLLLLGYFDYEVTLVRAECMNGCSGHGKCSIYDMCYCNRNWQGNDCGERVCPYGRAWVDSPKGDLDGSGTLDTEDIVAVNSAQYPYGTTESYAMMQDSDMTKMENSGHDYAECSNVGICNRKTGECTCQPGYEGTACSRQSCPGYGNNEEGMAPDYYGGQCSGHGVCSSLGDIAKRSYNSIYALWDKDQSTACVCDPGYHGADCHKRRCKRDLDPQYLDDVTTINFGRYYFPILTKRYEDSSDAAWFSGIPGERGYFTIKYYDHEGQAYQTDRIYEGAECDEIIAKLEALPGNLIPAGMTACQKATVFNVSALEPRARLRMKYYSRYTSYFSGPRENAVQFNPTFWLLDYTSTYLANATGDVRINGTIYRMEFLGNYGEIRQPEISLWSDGKKPTLQMTDGSPVFTNVWSDGQRSEGINYWSLHCDDVQVSIQRTGDILFLTGFGYGEKNKLKACLGRADHDDSNNGDNSIYDWDHGSVDFPHVVRLVRTVTDVTDSGYYVPLIYDTSLTGYDDSAESINLFNEDQKGPAPVYTDGTFRLLIPFLHPDGIEYVSQRINNVKYEVYTTKGVTQRVGNWTEVAFDFASHEIYATNVSRGSTYDGDIACRDVGMEHSNPYSIQNNSMHACMSKGDYFFLFDPVNIDFNPKYMNLYRADAVFTKEIAPTDGQARYSTISDTRYDDASGPYVTTLANYKRHVVYADITTNWAQEVGDEAVFYMYKFFPSTESTYEYVAECSNRGICNEFEGLCECFIGYTGQACESHFTVTL